MRQFEQEGRIARRQTVDHALVHEPRDPPGRRATGSIWALAPGQLDEPAQRDRAGTVFEADSPALAQAHHTERLADPQAAAASCAGR